MKKLLTFFLTALLTFSVGWAATETDVLVATDLAATNTTYTNFSGVLKPSGAVYAGNSAKNGSSIQLRSSNNNSGIVSTTSGGKIKSVTINFDALTTADKTIDVYGKNSAYTSATDLYSSSTQGTKLGSVTQTVGGAASSGTVTVSGDYEYIGIRSKSGAIYLASVSIEWETGGSTVETCATPTFSPAAGTYNEAQDVTISTTTSGASIYYTTDGYTPSTTNGTLYTGAINVSETTTIKAIAVKTGNNDSQVAEATYTIETGGGDSGSKIYRKVTSTDDLVAGKKYIIVYEGTPAFMGAISTTSTKYGLSITGPSISNNKVNIAGYGIKELTLSGSSTGWSFHNGDGYLTWTSGNSLNVAASISNNSMWTVSGNTTDGFILTNVATTSRVLKYNSTSGQQRFACYESGQQRAILYVQESTDPTLTATPTTLTLTDIPYDGSSTSGTIHVAGTYLTDNVTISVSGADFSVSPTTISPADGTVDENITVTYSGSSTTEVTATVTITCGDLTETVTVTAKRLPRRPQP